MRANRNSYVTKVFISPIIGGQRGSLCISYPASSVILLAEDGSWQTADHTEERIGIIRFCRFRGRIGLEGPVLVE